MTVFDGLDIPAPEWCTVMDAIVWIAVSEAPVDPNDGLSRFIPRSPIKVGDQAWADARHRLLFRAGRGDISFHGICVLGDLYQEATVPPEMIREHFSDRNPAFEAGNFYVLENGTEELAFIDLRIATADLFKLWPPVDGKPIRIGGEAVPLSAMRSRLPGDWIPLLDAFMAVKERTHCTDHDAMERLKDAAAQGVIFTRGQFHHPENEFFLIAPKAWKGMDRDFACNRLITPNICGIMPTSRTPFLRTPVICDVCVHWGSLLAWMDGRPKPERPEFPPLSEYRDDPAVWGNPIPDGFSMFVSATGGSVVETATASNVGDANSGGNRVDQPGPKPGSPPPKNDMAELAKMAAKDSNCPTGRGRKAWIARKVNEAFPDYQLSSIERKLRDICPDI